MRYKFTISFRGGRTEFHEADNYTTDYGILQLQIHSPHLNSKIKIFPLADISEINREDKSA